MTRRKRHTTGLLKLAGMQTYENAAVSSDELRLVKRFQELRRVILAECRNIWNMYVGNLKNVGNFALTRSKSMWLNSIYAIRHDL
jgi:hypothetical protein